MRRAAQGLGRLAAVGGVVALVAPLYLAVVSSLAPEAELFGGVGLWPQHPTLEHYRSLFAERRFWLPVRNSLVAASATSALAIAMGAACAYAVSRLGLPGRRAWLVALLTASLLPPVALVAPLYLALRELHWIDTFLALVIPYLTFTLPLAVWLLAGVLRELPRELEEAAWMDGATWLGGVRHVVLPLLAPALASTAIVSFLACWNEFLFALAFTLGPDHQTVPVAVALFRGQYRVPWGEVLAATVVATLPVAVAVVAFQRWIVRGLTAGAVKG